MIVVTLPLRIPSAANMREHWAAKHRRVKAQRNAVALAVRPVVSKGLAERHERLVVTLTRIAVAGSRGLDGDNLQASFKAVRDQVAAELGIDDGDARIEWRYAQRRGKAWGVEISIATPEEVAA